MFLKTREKFDLKMHELVSEFEKFDFTNRPGYACLMNQIHHYVNHSADLLSLAGVHTKNNKIKHRLFSHALEEFGHENSAKLDVESLGFNTYDLPVFTSTKLFYRNQYYLIEKKFGEAFFGYILMLEGIAVLQCKSISEKVKSNFNEVCNRFMHMHADEDPDHLDKAFETLKIIDPEKIKVIEDNMLESTDLFIDMIRKSALFGAQQKPNVNVA